MNSERSATESPETSARPLVQTSAAGRVLRVTLDNPPDNRINAEVLEQLAAAVDQAESEEFDLLLIQGGRNAFSKGFDLSALGPQTNRHDLRDLLVLSNALFSRIARFPKPTVAAISGACLGGGLELALACHLRLCSDRARLGLPEVWIKLVPGLGGVYRLAKLTGPAKALELTMLGDLINAEEALRLNVVSRVYPRDEFAKRVDSFIEALLMADRRVIREVIHLIACTKEMGEEDNLRQGMESFARLAESWVPPQ